MTDDKPAGDLYESLSDLQSDCREYVNSLGEFARSLEMLKDEARKMDEDGFARETPTSVRSIDKKACCTLFGAILIAVLMFLCGGIVGYTHGFVDGSEGALREKAGLDQKVRVIK